MTFEELKQANELIETTAIKGRQYAEVPQRVKAFRSLYPNGDILTRIISIEGGVCVMQCDIYDESGNHLATGTAYEKEGSTFINKESYIENCETSCVGRALGFLGLIGGESIASYEEVANAKLQQMREKAKDAKIPTNDEFQTAVRAATRIQIAIIKRSCTEDEIDKLCEQQKVDKIDNLTAEQAEKIITLLEKAGKYEP